jgi:hypothetical protein
MSVASFFGNLPDRMTPRFLLPDEILERELALALLGEGLGLTGKFPSRKSMGFLAGCPRVIVFADLLHGLKL